MDFISFLLLLIIPATALIFTLRFKGYMSTVSAGPLVLLLLGTFVINSNPPTYTDQSTVTSTPQATTAVIYDGLGTLQEMTSRASSNPARGQLFNSTSVQTGQAFS